MEQKTESLANVREIARNATFIQMMMINTNGVIKLDSKITGAIRAYSRDENQSDSLLALMDFYNTTRLMDITNEMGIYFLQKLKDGEIRIYNEKTT